MRRSVWCVLAATIALLNAAPAEGAVNVYVGMKDDYFTNRDVAVGVGAVVAFTKQATAHPHNARESSKIFTSGAPTTGSKTIYVKFSSGTYRYYCERHYTSSGMHGVVRVPVHLSSSPDGLPFTVRWAVSGVSTGSRWDVQYKVGSGGTWRTWYENTSSYAAVFGSRGTPVSLRDGWRYHFRARSRKVVDGFVKLSVWSPERAFAP